MGGSELLQGQEAAEEQDSHSIDEPLSLKPGVRKKVLGDLQKAISFLEHQQSKDSVGPLDELDHQELQEIMHLRLIGEVFIQPRSIYQHGRKIRSPSRQSL